MFNKSKKSIFYLAMISFFLSNHSNAANFEYNYVDVGFFTNPEGLGVNSAFTLLDGLHLVADASSQFKGDWIASAGVGFHAPANNMIDIIGDMRIYNARHKNDDKNSLGDFAHSISVGARSWFGPQLETNIRIGQMTFSSSDKRSIVELGARFHSTDDISIGLVFNANGLLKQRLFFNVRYKI